MSEPKNRKNPHHSVFWDEVHRHQCLLCGRLTLDLGDRDEPVVCQKCLKKDSEASD